MILNVLFSKEWHHGESPNDAQRLISTITSNAGRGWESGEALMIDEAWICFSEEKFERTDIQYSPNSYLKVNVNGQSGYGALAWYATSGGDVWISDNPWPPSFDPRVTSDPHYPRFYDRRSTIPLEQVQAALEEFCFSRSGTMPACVQWIVGSLNGQRSDQVYEEEVMAEAPENPWG